MLCTNTMHKVAPQIEGSIAIPLLHIADPTGAEIRARGITTVGLLGTRFTMEQDFLRDRLVDRYGLSVRIPDAADRKVVHRIIYDELCQGEVRPASKAQYVEVMRRLVAQGAEGIILGCTEISLLVSDDDCAVPLFDTTRRHAIAAVEWATA